MSASSALGDTLRADDANARGDTLVSALQRAAHARAHDGEALGVHFVGRDGDDVFFSYADLATRAAHVAGGLQALGIVAGDRVALVLPTCPEFYDAFFGAVWLGAIPVPLYPPQRLGKLDEFHARTTAMLKAVGARIVVTDTRAGRLLGQSVERARPALGCVHAAELRTAALLDAACVDANAVALIQFSSGTTVDPKPVALTHRQLVANMQAISGRLRESLSIDDVNKVLTAVSWLPMYHDMGLIGCMLTCMFDPTRLALIPPELFVARPGLWLQTISRFRANVSAAPNFAYSYCAERVRDSDLDDVDLRHWEVALNGAEPVTTAAMRAFSVRFAPWGFRREALTPVYGLAEASLAVTFSSPTEAFRTHAVGGVQRVSVGRPLENTQVRIVSEDGAPSPAGRVGRVHVRGPSVMQGYFERPEATGKALREGWLDTGDLGFLHGGELHLTGRAKDLIILRGRNHVPQDIEQHVNDVPGVRTGCAVAVGCVPEGTSGGEELLLLVERHAEAPHGDDADLARVVREKVLIKCGLQAYDVVILEPGTLPRTSSGKLRRQAALQQHLDGTLAAPKKVNALSIATAMVKSKLALGRAQRPADSEADGP